MEGEGRCTNRGRGGVRMRFTDFKGTYNGKTWGREMAFFSRKIMEKAHARGKSSLPAVHTHSYVSINTSENEIKIMSSESPLVFLYFI